MRPQRPQGLRAGSWAAAAGGQAPGRGRHCPSRAGGGPPLEAERELRGGVPRGAAEGASLGEDIGRTGDARGSGMPESVDSQAGLSRVLGAGAAGRGVLCLGPPRSPRPTPGRRWQKRSQAR